MNKVINIGYMFNSCKSLIKLPNISLWNISNVIDISHLFYEYQLLINLPDISK